MEESQIQDLNSLKFGQKIVLFGTTYYALNLAIGLLFLILFFVFSTIVQTVFPRSLAILYVFMSFIPLAWFVSLPFGPIYLYQHNLLGLSALPLVPPWVFILNGLFMGLVFSFMQKHEAMPPIISRAASKVLFYFYKIKPHKILERQITQKLDSKKELYILVSLGFLLFQAINMMVVSRRMVSNDIGAYDYVATIFQFPLSPFIISRSYWSVGSVKGGESVLFLFFNIFFWSLLFYGVKKHLGVNGDRTLFLKSIFGLILVTSVFIAGLLYSPPIN